MSAKGYQRNLRSRVAPATAAREETNERALEDVLLAEVDRVLRERE